MPSIVPTESLTATVLASVFTIWNTARDSVSSPSKNVDPTYRFAASKTCSLPPYARL